MQTDPMALVLSRLSNVKKHGDKYMASAPTRRDANPSLSIRRGDDGRVLLHDFGGSTTEEIVAALGLELGDLFADDKTGWRPMAQTTGRPATKRTYQQPVLPEEPGFGAGSVKWFAARGIGEETMRRFGIYTGTHYFRKLGKDGPAICFPYRHGGKVVNVKFRSPEVKDFAMWEDAEPCFFNIDGVPADAETVIVVEGEMDVLALDAAGVANAISPPGGCESLGEEVMRSGEHLLANDRVRVILAGDMDAHGEKMMEALVQRIGRERCARVIWPEGSKDANDTLLAHGAEKVRECIAGAEPYPVDGIVSIRDISDDLWKLYADGIPPGLSTGIPALDAIYTVAPGQFTTVTGAPGGGKTTLIDNFVVNLGQSADWRFGICSMENRRVTRHAAGIAQKFVGKPFREGFRERMSAEDLMRAEEWMAGHIAFIKPEETTMESVLRAAKSLVYRMGLNAVVIDPWNRIRHPASMNSGDYVADALNRITEFADRFNVHVFLVAHPTKLIRQADGNYPAPDGWDISGSAHFNNMSDYIVSIRRDIVDYTNPPEVYCKKSRFDEIASIGSVTLGFDRPTGRFYDLTAAREAAQGRETIATWRPELPAERYEKEEERWEDKTYSTGAVAGD